MLCTQNLEKCLCSKFDYYYLFGNSLWCIGGSGQKIMVSAILKHYVLGTKISHCASFVIFTHTINSLFIVVIIYMIAVDDGTKGAYKHPPHVVDVSLTQWTC